MKDYLKILLVIVCALIAGCFLHRCQNRGINTCDKPATRDTVVVRDTVRITNPTLRVETQLGTRSYTLPVYSFLGCDKGFKPQLSNIDYKESIALDTISNLQYGLSAGGEPRSSIDSATVELPMIQRHYADSTYEAWVSGPVDPRLDSVRVFAQTTIITKREWKPHKRWHIGVTAGYGYTIGQNRFNPYIGVGITYSIISF